MTFHLHIIMPTDHPDSSQHGARKCIRSDRCLSAAVQWKDVLVFGLMGHCGRKYSVTTDLDINKHSENVHQIEQLLFFFPPLTGMLDF